MVTPLYAFTDESGNTGLDIFHREQKIFYTLTLFAKSDLNVAAASPVASWCQRLGVEHLHGSETGSRRLEMIAPAMLEFLMAETPLFIATMVEKRHMAAMKFADTVLDSGLNPAVSGFHYGTGFRLLLALELASSMSLRNQRDFWDAFRDLDLDKFRHVVSCVEGRIAIYHRDPRVRELLGDALRWARDNPGALLVKRSNLDAPNLVAFSFIIDQLHQMLKGSGLKVKHFVHDEQNQFMKSFKKMYAMVTQYRREDVTPVLLPTWEDADTFDCPLTEESSRESPALQIVDVLLWLFRRQIAKGTTGSAVCDKLLYPLMEFGVVREFSRQQLVQSVQGILQGVASAPVSRKQLRAATKIQTKIEAERKARIKQPT